MARPTKQVEVVDVIDTTVDQEKMESAMSAMREQAQEDQLELLELAGDVGALRALDLTRSLVAAATVRIFQKISSSNKINDLPIRQADGSVATATNLDEFCRLAFGKPRSAMFEASATLEALGDDAYESASRLGLNRNSLRAARALPPEKLEVVRLAIGNGGTKADILSIIEDLAEKVEESNKAFEDAKAEIDAKEQLLAEKNKSIDKLKASQKRIHAASPDEVLADIKKEAVALAADAEGAVLGGLRQAILALSRHGEIDAQKVFMAGLVGQVQAQLSALRIEFNLPDISNAADQDLAAEVAAWAE